MGDSKLHGMPNSSQVLPSLATPKISPQRLMSAHEFHIRTGEVVAKLPDDPKKRTSFLFRVMNRIEEADDPVAVLPDTHASQPAMESEEAHNFLTSLKSFKRTNIKGHRQKKSRRPASFGGDSQMNELAAVHQLMEQAQIEETEEQVFQ